MTERPEPSQRFSPDPPSDPLDNGYSNSDEDAVAGLLESVSPQTQPAPLLTDRNLEGRVAIVTGASSGIGQAVAREFATAGTHVGFNFLDAGSESRVQAQRVAEELRNRGVKVVCRSCDVRDPAAVKGFVKEVESELGGLHFLVNNAGIGRDRALWRMTDEEWESVLNTNLSGAFFFIRAVTPFLRAQEWGKIVNVASVHGIRGEFGLANYISSKAGLIGLTRSAAIELGRSNVNVNAVAPGYIRTTQLTEQVPAELLDRAREKSLLGRLGDPQDVANVVLFLCSEGARHMTGAVIPIDGGYLL